MKLAVVEDNAMIRSVLLAVLEDMPDCLASGFEAALPALEACQHTDFDLFILDQRLPDLTGLETLQKLRADPRFAHAPVVMVTADSDRALRLEAIRAGATDFLTKPFNIEELRLRLGNLLALRQAQKDVAARENLLSAVIDASTASIVIGDATRPEVPLILANRAFERLSGYDRAEVLGQNCRFLSAEAPDHPVRRALHDAVTLRQSGKFRLRNRRRSGELFWNQIDLHPVPAPGPMASYIVATQTDVTAEVEASQSRDRLDARLAGIAQLSGAWFFEFDRDLRLSYLSAAMARALDVVPEEVQGLSVDTVGRHIAVDLAGQSGSLRALFERREAVSHVSLRVQRRDGSFCWMQASAAPFLTVEGAFDGIRGFASDVSALVAARDAAQRAERAQAAFIAMMSHELRTPLTAIIGLSEMLEASCRTESRRVDLATIRQAATDLTDVLADVLDHTQLESGQLTLASAPVSLADLLSAMVEEHRPKAVARGLDLRLEVEGEASALRLGDAGRLRQILRNLLDNALRFTETGSVRLTLDLADDAHLAIEVADTGIGVKAEDHDRIFLPFFQVDASMGRTHTGRGLGLSIARKLTEAMGGRLSLRSALGEGAVFRLDLPLRVPPGLAASGGSTKAIDLTGATVLVADDNAANRKLLSLMLSRLGAEVTLAEDGRAALDAWAPDRFDALLLDINMPALTGTEVISEIRLRERCAQLVPVPAFAVTANARPEQVETYRAAGFDGCIAKPLNLGTLSGALGPRLPQH
ncbi:MAG TPA: response regulator [Gemmobacter sp.]|nr:response regulator [Gemmobacter sp.]